MEIQVHTQVMAIFVILTLTNSALQHKKRRGSYFVRILTKLLPDKLRRR